MKNHKSIIIILLTLIPASIFSQNYDSDSLVKTHKKVAVLPVRIMYSFKALPNGLTFSDIKRQEIQDGFSYQERFINQMLKDSVRMLVEVQRFNETNQLLIDNEVKWDDLEDLSADFICEILKVDAIIQTEIRLSKILSDNERTAVKALYFADLLYNPITTGGAVVRAPAKFGKNHGKGQMDDKLAFTKMMIADGKTGDTLKEYSLNLDGGVFTSSDAMIKHALWVNFKKSPYYRK